MSNPMLDKLRKATGKGASQSATDAAVPEATAEPAAEPDAPAQSAEKASGEKKLSPLERMKQGLNKGKKGDGAKAAAEGSSSKASTASSSSKPADDAAGVNPPPKKRGRKPAQSAKAEDGSKTTTTPSTAEKSATPAKAPAKSKRKGKTLGSVLMVGCYPIQGMKTPVQLYELLDDVKKVVCETNNVPHWGFIDYKSDAILAHALDLKLTEEGVPHVLAAEPFSAESRAVEQVLLKHYEVVIRGLR